MFCRNCRHEVSDLAVVCVSCGCPPKAGSRFCNHCGAETPDCARVCLKCGVPVYPAKLPPPLGAKSQTAYVLLGALLGLCLPGIHNLYAGRTGIGITQVLLTLLSCYCLWIPMYIWTIVDICTITTDAEGNPLV